MSIATGQIITWSDFTGSVLSSIKSVCCNIDNVNNVPTRLRSGQGQVAIGWVTTSVNAGGTAQTFTYYANPAANLISAVSTSTVESEWSTFLSAAGANARSGKIIQALDLSKAMGLFMQFMSYHLKPVHSRRQIYNNLDGAQSVYSATKYVTGTVTPKYTLTAIEPSNIPTVSDNDISTMICQNIINSGINWGVLAAGDDPKPYRCYLS